MKVNKFEKIEIKKKTSRIAIVQARFNSEVTDKLTEGAVEALILSGVKKENIFVFQTPGSFEIPIVCQRLALKKKFDGIIAIGAVIKGETAHFEYISRAVTDGIMKVMLKQSLPIAFGVLTTYNLLQAQKRAVHGRENKGGEVALALIETLNQCNSI